MNSHFDQDIIPTKTSTKAPEKSIVFSSKLNESNESDSDDNYDMEAMDLFTKNFKRFFKEKNHENEKKY